MAAEDVPAARRPHGSGLHLWRDEPAAAGDWGSRKHMDDRTARPTTMRKPPPARPEQDPNTQRPAASSTRESPPAPRLPPDPGRPVTRRPETQRSAAKPAVTAAAKPLPAVPGLIVRGKTAMQPAGPGDKTVRPPRQKANAAKTVGRHARRWGLCLMLVGAVLGLALAGLYTRLLFGPMSLDWLKGPIERAIERELPGLEVGIGAVVLRRGEWGGAEFRLVNVKIKQANGVTVAEAPLAAIGLSGRGLLKATVAPASVELVSP